MPCSQDFGSGDCSIEPWGRGGQAVGQLLAGVDEMGLDLDTLWFFTSDNGSPLGNDNHGNGPLFDGKFTTCAQQRPSHALTSLPPC